MKVLQVNSVSSRGSTGKIVQEVSLALRQAGHASLIAFGRGEGGEADTAFSISSAAEVARHMLSSRLFDNHGWGSPKATQRLLNLVHSSQPDIVHLHNIHGYYLNYGGLLRGLNELGTPIVWTLHDAWPFTGHCAYFDYVGCDKWQIECGACPQKHSYPTSWVLDRSASNYRRKRAAASGLRNLTIVTPSQWLKSLVKASFLQEYRTEVIPNDPDFSHFKPSLDNSWRRERGLEGKYLILGVANKWEPRKGLRFLIELSENLRPDELLVVVGQQPRGERLPHNCIAVPHVTSSTELAEIYAAADIFVNPTLEDNYPTTNLEALACGTPVITFDSGGSGETVARGSGLVLGSRTTASIRTAIDSMRQELRTVDIMSPRGLLHVQERSMAEKYLGLYNDILGRGENSDGQSHPSS